jgi:hypothetical protein
MATRGAGGDWWESYRVLVKGIPMKSNREMFVKNKLKRLLPGEVVDVNTQGTTNAVVTLQCPRGQSRYVSSENPIAESDMTISNLGTLNTTLTMENVSDDVTSEFDELAQEHEVVFERTETGFIISGLIDRIYNLRAEFDARLLWREDQKAPQRTATSNLPLVEGTENVGRSRVATTSSSYSPSHWRHTRSLPSHSALASF